MKTDFELNVVSDSSHVGEIKIVGQASKGDSPYVRIGISSNGKEFVCACIKDNDLKRFATNILKALK
jgi:hypothetical protein